MASVWSRLRERAEEITGYRVREANYVEQLEESAAHFSDFANEVEDLTDLVLDHIGGRPRETSLYNRRALTRQSRTAFIRDPIAGAEASLRANFAFGRGIPRPQAADPEVQRIIDEAWDDPNNKRKLTSFAAQRKRSNDLLTGANLFPVFFAVNGRVRIGFHNELLVTDVVTHPEDDETPLWYVVRKTRRRWDFETHQELPYDEDGWSRGEERVYYLEHWRNVEDAEREAELMGTEKPPRPKPSDILPGKAEHIAINQIGRTEFGIPPWARTLRFYSAMNQLTEAQVRMRAAAATLIAKRVRRGGPRDLVKAASTVAARAGELAAARFGSGAVRGHGPGTNPRAGGAPPPTGSWWVENESDRLEAVRLSSGAGEALQDAQIVRAPLAAASGFGPHYLGDPGSTNLATATTLELPTLMETRAWQETFESLYRLFIDLVIEEAVRAGRLGGIISEGADDGRPLRSLRLREDREEMEQRVGRDLSYTLEMPYPGRRNLPDVVNMVTAVAAAYDPQGQNIWLRRKLLDFLARHGLEVEDPARWVDEVLPEDQAGMVGPEGMFPPGAGPGGGGEGAAPVTRDPREQGDQSQYGERRRGGAPEDEMGTSRGALSAALRERSFDPELEDELSADVDREFAALLDDPEALLYGKRPAVSLNGSSANGAPPPSPLP